MGLHRKTVTARLYSPDTIYVLDGREYVEMQFDAPTGKFFFSRPYGGVPATPWDEVSEQVYKPATGKEYMGYRPYLDRNVIDALIDKQLGG